MDRTEAETFYEDDEDPQAVREAWERVRNGEGVTTRPGISIRRPSNIRVEGCRTLP